MHTDIGIRPRVGSLAANLQGWIRSRAPERRGWVASLGKKAKEAVVVDRSAKWIHDTIPPVAVLVGAAALGLWSGSISAGLFAGVGLFFLAGIYRALRQIVAILRLERERRGEPKFEASARAIEHLQPWVAGETSLTEESAKACCAVLLDSLATLRP
jgi:hypothetical protein